MFSNVDEKMYSVFTMTMWLVFIEAYFIDNKFCEYKCNLRQKDEAVANNRMENGNLCSADNIPSNITMTVIVNDEGSSHAGILRIDLNPLKTACIYKVALVVDSSTKNSEECEKHLFRADEISAEDVHTAERTICILDNAFNNSDHTQELKIPFCQDADNVDQKLVLWYENVYSGCYALRFKVDYNKFVFRGRKLVKTNHQRSKIVEPKFHCKYTAAPDKNPGFETLAFATSISLVEGFAGSRQEIALLSPSDNAKKDACIKHHIRPIFTYDSFFDVSNGNSDNCTTLVAENTVGKNVECNFEMRSFKNSDYCFLIHLIDERCKKHTGWDPPKKGFLPCSWVQPCTRIETNHSVVVYSGNISSHRHVISSDFLCLPLLVIALLALLAVAGSIFCTYRLRTRNSKYNSSTCSMDLKEEADFKCLEVEEFKFQDNVKKQKEIVRDIILLYVNGPKSFMKLMSEFRKTLEQCIKCHVYDWYAPEEWDNAATVGGYEWVVKLLRKDCRVVWIDTSRARSLFITQYNLIGSKVSRNTQIDDFVDFRDTAFPAIVDLAKRSFRHIILQYSRHYIVRIEGLEILDEANDPFSDLSPHVRYLIPRHLQELCSHLSIQSCIPEEEEVQSEEKRLREHLILLENN